MESSSVTLSTNPTNASVGSLAPAPSRLDSVDLLRGLAMVFMLLDHTRDFIMNSGSPTNLATATPALFFTRWITHFCAPTFMLLAGVGAALSLSRGKTKAQLSWFLFTRGLWIIFLEFTLGRWGLNFSFNYGFLWLIILWALGAAMIFLAAVIHLPRWAIAAISFAMIAGHNFFDGVQASALGHLSWLWILLHQQGPFSVAGHVVFDAYPLIPWVAVMSVGFLLGPLLTEPKEQRIRTLLSLGTATTLAFIVLRAINHYGDPSHWKTLGSPLMTLCSFLNTTKQPPSLLFLAMTLGPALILLALLDRPLPRWTHPVLTFGRVPLFYFLVHMPLAHLLGIAVAAMTGQDYQHFLTPLGPFEPAPANFGHGLGVTYLTWLAGLIILYPMCAWFAGVKQRNKASWLSYL